MDESYCFTGYSTSGETALKNVFTVTLKKYFHWTSSNLVFSNALTQNSHSDILSNFYTILRYSWSPKHVSDSSDSTDSIHWTDNWVWCTLPLLHHHTPGIPDCRPVRSVQCTPIMALTRIRISAGKKPRHCKQQQTQDLATKNNLIFSARLFDARAEDRLEKLGFILYRIEWEFALFSTFLHQESSRNTEQGILKIASIPIFQISAKCLCTSICINITWVYISPSMVLMTPLCIQHPIPRYL